MSDNNFRRLLAHSKWLRPMARALVRDEHVAEDLLQETYLAALEKPPEKGPVAAWLGGVLRNRARMHHRGSLRRTHRETRAARTEVPDGPGEDERLELRLDLVHSLLDLDEPYRSTLILRFYDDLTPSEIAEAEGIPAATVRVRLKRGLERLREQYEKRSKAGLIILLLIAEFPDVDAGMLWSEFEAEAAKTVSTTASTRGRWIGVAAPALLVLVLFLAFGGGLALSENRDSNASTVTPAARSTLERGRPSLTEPPSPEFRRIDRRAEETATPNLGSSVRIEVRDARGLPVENAEISTGPRRLERDQISTGYANAIEFLLRDPTPIELGKTDATGSLLVPLDIARSEPLTVRSAGHRVHREGPTLRQIHDGAHEITLDAAIPTTVTVYGDAGRAVGPVSVTRIDERSPKDVEVEVVLSGGQRWETTIEERVPLLRVESQGFASVQDFLTAPRCDVALPRGAPLRGKILDPEGRPVVGASVAVRTKRWRGPPASTVTDSLGEFTTISVAKDENEAFESVSIEIRHEDFAIRRIEFEAPTQDLDPIVLDSGFELGGSVAGPDGVPVSNARVIVLRDPLSPRDITEVSTDEYGQFAVDHLPHEQVIVRVEPSSLAADLAPIDVAIDLSKDSSRDRAFVLEAAERIAGVVRTSEGIPVAGMPFRLGWILGDELRGDLATTDSEGRFELSVPKTPRRHRARRSMLRWRTLSKEQLERPSRVALLETFLPYQLLRVDGNEVESIAHYGSRNVAAVLLDRDANQTPIEIVVAPPVPRPVIEFGLVSPAGEPVVAFTNVLIASPDDWTMKDFAGLDGRPFHLPNPRVLDDAVVTVMARGYPWSAHRIDLARTEGRVEFTVHPPFEHRPTLTLDSPRAIELLVSPLVDARDPLIAIPIGSTDENGSLELDSLGPGNYLVSTPRDATSLLRKNGRRRSSLPIEDVHVLGEIQVGNMERQEIKLSTVIDALERNRP